MYFYKSTISTKSKILQANLKFIVMLSAEKYPQNKKASITADHFIQIIISADCKIKLNTSFKY